MQLDDALSQIAQIRKQIAHTEVFRGYRSATTAFSGAVALTACWIQSRWLVPTVENYLALWAGAAALSLVVVGAEMYLRCQRSGSRLQTELSQIAVEQFMPCLVSGALLTVVFLRFAPEVMWMLPGIWAILFGLGIFSSRRVLPRGTPLVGAWYLLSGLGCVARASRTMNFDAWEMAVTFGFGQFFAAGLLYWFLERNHVGQA